ncbi:hypothetical protein Emin_0223 [Elusimicrobium minutum Pei191]|uniref:Three-Cys-motif partner protein TcmP n=1 Tax=Elusimicrobium minutum (strain Pei191) TaxID=445932 RepID=B2KB26_ELUMP|nr:three-Cys-motif partner protein TcmP [Elusimicrobium minutum]ACC97785.1 hypothetical protein Emin_0223 [Elusimicrobium minutum Pei191]
MDTSGKIKFHTKLKLKIYEEYLKAYLPIMNTQDWATNVSVIEPFAGQGVAEDGGKGSAMVAVDAIKPLQSQKILLLLNDLDSKKIPLLSKNVDVANNPFIKIANEDANSFINKSLKFKGHALLFIDPFGYTQLNKDTYDNIFNRDKLEILIFIPLYHVFRFLKGEEEDVYYRPVAQFLEYFDIAKEQAQECDTLEDFAQLIRSAFQSKMRTHFAYYKSLKNKDCNSQHVIFFLSKNIKGAEKFLYAAEAAEKYFDKQGDLFSMTYDTFKEEADTLINTIKNADPITNSQLYELSISLGMLPKYTNEIFSKLEDDKTVCIKELPNCKRKGKSLYINDKRDNRIEIIYNKV